jgi:hypothetical protein
VCRADNLTTFMCRLSINLGALTSWNPKSLSRPVVGLLYLYTFKISRLNKRNSETKRAGIDNMEIMFIKQRQLNICAMQQINYKHTVHMLTNILDKKTQIIPFSPKPHNQTND